MPVHEPAIIQECQASATHKSVVSSVNKKARPVENILTNMHDRQIIGFNAQSHMKVISGKSTMHACACMYMCALVCICYVCAFAHQCVLAH